MTASPLAEAGAEGGDVGDETDGVAVFPPARRSRAAPEAEPRVFGDLLRSLADEFDRHMGDLRAENGRLRKLIAEKPQLVQELNGELQHPQEPNGELHHPQEPNGASHHPQEPNGVLVHDPVENGQTHMVRLRLPELRHAAIPGALDDFHSPEQDEGAMGSASYIPADTESHAEVEKVRKVSLSSLDLGDEKELTFALTAAWKKGMLVRGNNMAFGAADSLRKEASYVSRAAKAFKKRSAPDMMEEPGSQDLERGSRIVDQFMISPFCTKRMVWDGIAAVLLGYDMLMIPMGAFMQDEDTDDNWRFMDVWELLATCYWTLDIFASLLTGVVVEGTLRLNFDAVWRRYRKTWFPFDLLIVFQDWFQRVLASLSSSDSAGSPAGRIMRLARAARILRLFRLAKLQRMLTVIRDKVESEYFFVFVNVSRLVLVLLVINHYLASGWWFFGDLGRKMDAKNWIEAYDFYSEKLGYQYLTSLHWSLTQFTPGSMTVQPHNSGERIFAILILIFGMVYISSFIGSISASMTQLRNLQSDKTKQIWYLRRYLREHSVPDSLVFRVLRYTEHAVCARKEQVPKDKVEVLKLLSDSLHNELDFFVSFKRLLSHPAFEHLQSVSGVALYGLAGGAIEMWHLAMGERLFGFGTKASTMFFINSGSLKYRLWREDSWIPTDLTEADWLLEQALYTDWTTHGEVQAISASDLIAINGQKFVTILQEDARAFSVMADYAWKFIEWLNALPPTDLTDVFKDSQQRAWQMIHGQDRQSLDSVGVFNRLTVLSGRRATPRSSANCGPPRTTLSSASLVSDW